MTSERDIDKYCVFRQADSLFALPATCVVEVSPSPAMVSVPNSDPVLAGIAHLRNEFIPVLELRALTGEPSIADLAQKQLLVVRGTNGPWAILVDRVVGLESLEISNSQEIQDADDFSAAVIGSASLQNQITRILNPSVLYRLAEDVLRQSWAAASAEPSLAGASG